MSGLDWAALRDAYRVLRDTHGLTHIGTTPGHADSVIVWAVRYPDPTLLLIAPPGALVDEYAEAVVIREAWERITDMPPPWPWDSTGRALDFTATHPTVEAAR